MASRKIELLAPAGTPENGLSAINCGADAVYIGAPRFGAREAAGNSVRAIERLCTYAHKYWARVYAAVNTILTDAELEDARQLIWQLHGAGADAVIIQDAGLLEIDLPPLPLIASTQMHNATPEKVAFLESVGFSRIILARELSLAEIQKIRAYTRVELECFVHGALCVSYSGRCSMSYGIGGRSGNRGQCAQPCRRRYRLQDAAGAGVREAGHFLCLKDLNLSEHLRELIDAGICSFKIEGRLKDTAYVVNAVAAYRRLLDEILNGKQLRKSSSGSVECTFEPDLQKTFNRGYTTYFLAGPGAGCASLDTPAFKGEEIGPVAHSGADHMEIKNASQSLHNGDGICFFDRQGRLQGTNINTAQGARIFPARMAGLCKGTTIYRNYDHVFMQQLKQRPCRRHIGVSLRLSESIDGFVLQARDEDGCTAAIALAAVKQPAEKPVQAEATIKKQLAKLGGTDFVCTAVALDLSETYFLPASLLNRLRRSVIEELVRVRKRARPVKKGGAVHNSLPYPDKRLCYRDNVLNHKAEAFYRRHGVREIEPAAESGLDLCGREAMTAKYCLRRELGACLKTKAGETLPEQLYLIDDEGRRFRLRCDCKTCCMHIYFDG